METLLSRKFINSFLIFRTTTGRGDLMQTSLEQSTIPRVGNNMVGTYRQNNSYVFLMRCLIVVGVCLLLWSVILFCSMLFDFIPIWINWFHNANIFECVLAGCLFLVAPVHLQKCIFYILTEWRYLNKIKKSSCRVGEKELFLRKNKNSVQSIKFSSFKELAFHSNIFQRLFGWGNIYIRYEVFHDNHKVTLSSVEQARELYNELVAKTGLISKGNQYSI
jgi:hypothetical protein